MKIIDTHCHTNFSLDAHGTMREHCLSAVEKKVSVICFTDHIDIDPPFCNLETFEYEKRYNQYRKCVEEFPDITILLGLEFAEPNRHYKHFCRIVGNFDYDFILGSVHYPCDMIYEGVWDLQEGTAQHYERTKELAQSRLCDSLAHLDFPKKFIPDFQIDKEKTQEILSLLVQNDTSLEINYSPLRRGQKDSCPDVQALRQYVALGGKYVTLGSDSHHPLDIASPFDKGESIFSQVQGLECCYYVGRKRVSFL